MKNIFPGYYKKSKEELTQLWENGIICFDANVLLNLYRYSEETRNELLNLIEKFSEKIWLPHQVALEYNRNRYEVIADQEKAYKEFVSKIKQIEDDLKSTTKPPFLSRKNHNALKKVFKEVNSEVEESINKYCNYLQQDSIFEQVSDIFQDKISAAFEKDEFDKIISEGEKRYKQKIPPGFEDEKTKDGERKYGDLVLWKQIIKKATEEKKPIILITDERKIDWWWKIKDGRNMGPRQELVEEIKREANVDFHMYSSERFLTYGLKYLKEQINRKTLEEIQEFAKAEIKNINREKQRNKRRIVEREIKNERKYLELQIIKTQEGIKSLEHGLNIYMNEPIGKPETQERIIDYSIQLQGLSEELNDLKKRREYLSEKENNKFRYLKGFEFDEDN